jgi:hypothetical protein
VFLGFTGWVPFGGVFYLSKGGFSGSYKAQKKRPKWALLLGFGAFLGVF